MTCLFLWCGIFYCPYKDKDGNCEDSDDDGYEINTGNSDSFCSESVVNNITAGSE